MKNFLPYLFLLNLSLGSDSLDVGLNERPPLKQLQYLDSLANAQIHQNAYDALKTANEGLSLAIENKNLRYQSGFHTVIGNSMSNRGFFDKAIEHYLKAFELEIIKGDSSGMAWQTMSIGTVFFRQDRFVPALKQYQKAFELFKNIKDYYGMAVSLHNHGLVYRKQEAYQKELNVIERATQYCEISGDRRLVAYNLTLVGQSNLKLGNYSDAIHAIRESTKIYEEIGENYYVFSNYFILTDMWQTIENIDSTIHYLNLTEAKLSDSPFFRELPRFYIFQAKFYQKLGDLKKALKNINLGIKHASDHNLNNSKHDLLVEKIKLFEQSGDPEELITLYSQLLDLKDELYERRIEKNITKSEYQILQYEKDKELITKQYKIEKEKSIKLFFVTVSILSLIILIGMVYRYLFIKRTSKEILDKTNTIHHLEKEKLESELHHKEKLLMVKAMASAKNREWVIQVTRDLNKIGNPRDIIKKASKTIKDQLSSFDDWQEFETWFLEIHEDFMIQLKESYPNLTQREIQICAFLKLNLVTKDISNLTNLTVSSVEVYRSKIRKKMNLSKQDNLIHHISSI